MAHVPKTPNSKQVPSHASSLHSTPGNPGASATSRALEDFKVEEIRPLLMKDVQRFQLGDLDRYLHRILRAVNAIPAPAGDAAKATRPTDQVVQKELQECLTKVDEAVDTTSAEWAAIQDAFKKYSKAKGEADRYSHFVNAANKILAMLQHVRIGDTAPTGGEAIQFVVHDPTMIPSVHGGKPYGRKPDIVVSREKYISPLYQPLASSEGQESTGTAAPADPAGPVTPTSSGYQDADPLAVPASTATPAGTATSTSTTTPPSLDSQDPHPVLHSQQASPSADVPANLDSVPPASPADTATTTSPGALDTDPLAHLQSAPKRHLAWEKGLMFMEFKKRSSELNDPVQWNPQIGSIRKPTFESADDMKREVKQNLKAAGIHVNADGGDSSSAVPSTSHAAPSSANTTTTNQRSKSKNKARGGTQSKPSTRTTGASRAGRAVADDSFVSGSKRKRSAADSSNQGSRKKVKVAEELLVELATPAAVQLAEYAAESLYNTFGRSHVLGLLVKDATINIWHFDHERSLQITGFDFLRHQHYLFLFLLALQRFDNEDWGFLPGFDKLVGKDTIELDLTDAWADNQSAEERKFTCKKEDMKQPPFGLGGRATGVMYGSVNEKEVVVKLAWPEKNRNREKEFVDTARKRFNDMDLPDYNPGDYLPDILAVREYREFESGLLRDAVLCNASAYDKMKIGSRVPYFIVMPRYQPITDLTHNWDEFMAAFFALFYCHAMLWSIGIRHGDISETNLMWDPEEKKPKLCDFDLSHFCEAPQIGVPEKGPDGPLGLSNTGTWIFMAQELLTEEAMEGSVKRVYRHEVEAFIAVLVYIVCRYKDGEVRPGRPLEHWNQVDYRIVHMKRARSFREIEGEAYTKPADLSESLWNLIKAALREMGWHRDDLSRLVEKQRHLKDFPGHISSQNEAPEDFDDLCALRKKMLSWKVFAHTPAEPFVKVMKERILNPDRQYETNA